MNNRYLMFCVTTILLVSGCAAGEALQEMKDSKAAYKTCRDLHPQDSSACKREKEIYEAAGESYEGMAEGGNTLDAKTERH